MTTTTDKPCPMVEAQSLPTVGAHSIPTVGAQSLPMVKALGFSPANLPNNENGFSRGRLGPKHGRRESNCGTAKALSFRPASGALRAVLISRGCLAALVFCILSCSSGFGQHLRADQPMANAAGTSAVAGAPTPTTTSTSPPLMHIAAGDLVEITVFDTPELSQKTRVDNDGDVDLAVGGKVHLAGLTFNQANQALEFRLRDAEVLRNPHVSVNVLESANQTVTVLGEVKNPGSYPVWGQQRLAEAIAAAGGLTQNASHSATLTHKDSNATLTVQLDASAGGDTVLLPGDRIVVARAGIVYVLGDVGKPGGFVLDDRAPITVLQGLALAQGMNRTANSRGSLIRQTSQGPQQEMLDFRKILGNQSGDPTLHDGDIVYVPLNAVKDWANRGLNSILQMAVGVVIYGRY
jgi:polysaccharide biosynthesis/export protein